MAHWITGCDTERQMQGYGERERRSVIDRKSTKMSCVGLPAGPHVDPFSGRGETVESLLNEWNTEMGALTGGLDIQELATDVFGWRPCIVCILADMKAAAAGELKYASRAALAASEFEKQWVGAAVECGDNRLVCG